MTSPTVTIIVAAYSAASTIDAALQSVAAQSWNDWECLIIDDASEDETLQLAQVWSERDQRFKVLRSEVNSGPAVARNMGLQVARGEWITLLDADDLFEPDRLSILLQRAETLGVAIIFDNQWLLDAQGHRRRWLNLADGVLRQHGLSRFLYQVCGFSSRHWGIAQPLFRRSLLEGPPLLRYDPDLRFGEDVLLMAQLILRAERFGVCGYAGYVYRLPDPIGKNLSLAKTVDPSLSTHRLIDSLSTSIGWRERILLRLRLMHYELAAWRSNLLRSIQAKNYLSAASSVAKSPRGWLWLVLNACRRFLP
jgi:succinoglycan biosynthesis protein ExoO